MAISSRTNRFTFLTNLSRLRTLIFNLQRFNHTLAGEVEKPSLRKQGDSNAESKLIGTCNNDVNLDMSLWRVVNSKLFGIDSFTISKSSWKAVEILRRKGFKAYLVGGCVRDLLLDKIPKDFDVITTAELEQIKQSFHHARIVGRRFPICHVYLQGSMVEVSSFHTVVEGTEGEEPTFVSQAPNGCSSEDFVRWKNCFTRDFTINSLFYDPSANKIFDYTNGMRDLKLGKVQTVIPAHLSFREDCARIFRGIRIAARLGLSFSKETASAIHDLYLSLSDLEKQRVVLEMDYMFSYGAASSSLRLLSRFKILDIVLPFHAAYLSAQREDQTAQGSSMLFKLFSSLDKLVASDRPCTPCLWIALLAFHIALVKNPQDALVIWAFASVLYHGNWKEAFKFSREKSKLHVRFSPEISETSSKLSDKTLAEDVNRFASQVIDSIDVLTEQQNLVQSMEKYRQSPSSDLVFISKYKGHAVAKLFDVLLDDTQSYHVNRKSFEIDYRLLKRGNVNENRFVLGKIIMDVMNCGVNLDQQVYAHHLPLSDPEKHDKAVEKDTPRCLKQPPEAVEKKMSPLMSSNFVQQQKTIKKNDLSHNSTTVKWEDETQNDVEQGHQSYGTRQNQSEFNEKQCMVKKQHKLSSLFI